MKQLLLSGLSVACVGVLPGAPRAREDTAADKPTPLQFPKHLIRDKDDDACGLAAADLEGDGDLELTSQNAVGGRINLSSLRWFENGGQWTFERRLIQKANQDIGWFERHTVGEINSDGRLDVVVDNKFGRLVWFASNDRPAAGPWKRSVGVGCRRQPRG